MARSPLSPRELKICTRLGEIRDVLGISQAEAAKRLGIERHSWQTYEAGRAPLRTQLALKICRSLIISEEFLATGEFKIAEKIAMEKGLKPNSSIELRSFYISNCMDLGNLSPEISLIDSLYSEAYDKLLNRLYEVKLRENFYTPRLHPLPSDTLDLKLDFVYVMVKRWSRLLEGNRATQFLRVLTQFSHILFKRFMGWNTPEIELEEYSVIRFIVENPNGNLLKEIDSAKQQEAEVTRN